MPNGVRPLDKGHIGIMFIVPCMEGVRRKSCKAKSGTVRRKIASGHAQLTKNDLNQQLGMLGGFARVYNCSTHLRGQVSTVMRPQIFC